MFSCIQTTNEIVEIDPAKDAIVKRIPVEGGEGDHGLHIDSERRLAFAAPDLVTLWHVVYLLVMAAIGLRVAGRRLNRLLQP